MWLCEYNIQEPDHHDDNENKNIYVISSHLYHHVIDVPLDNNMTSLKSNKHWYGMYFNIDGSVFNGTGNHQSFEVYLIISHTRFSLNYEAFKKAELLNYPLLLLPGVLMYAYFEKVPCPMNWQN